jgi:hypothetical protein
MSDSTHFLHARELRQNIDRNSGGVASHAYHDLSANFSFSGLTGFNIMGSTNLARRRGPGHMEPQVTVSYVEEAVIHFAQILANCIRNVRAGRPIYALLPTPTPERSILFSQIFDSSPMPSCRVYFYLRSISLFLSVSGVQLILVLQGLLVIRLWSVTVRESTAYGR